MLAKIIRKNGVMNGKITRNKPTESDLSEAKKYDIKNAVSAVSGSAAGKIGGFRRVALMDFGAKQGIADALFERDCDVRVFRHNASVSEIMNFKPGGVMLSNGPGDPANPDNKKIVATIRTLMQSGIPIFGICLGHQLLAIANGYETQKLKFGHRGTNQPVKETATGRVFISSQNHGYSVIAKNSSFVNVNDGTCEGLDYGNSFSVQFHPEACGGPLDTGFLFDRFMERIDDFSAKNVA